MTPTICVLSFMTMLIGASMVQTGVGLSIYSYSIHGASLSFTVLFLGFGSVLTGIGLIIFGWVMGHPL